MAYGWMGSGLEVDLTAGTVEKKSADPKLYESYLGGKGINIKLFWDRVSPEVEPFSPENLLIISAGLLTGTPAPAGNHGCISYKSPLTKFFASSSIGGFWPAELRHAGYDTVVFSGKSPRPVYLWINNDQAELRDAAHLWGKDTKETQSLIQKELKNDKVQVLCIGSAGENMNTAATIQHGSTHSASRGGPGAIMGDKNLKAVAVFGTKDVSIARPAEFMKFCDIIMEKSESLRNYYSKKTHRTGEFAQEFMNWGVFGNVDKMPADFEHIEARQTEFVSKYLVREPACYNCPFKCLATIAHPDVGPVTLKCTSWWSFMCASKLLDLDFSVRCLDMCFRYGLDHLSAANRIAFAIALYQNGILTKEDTDGLVLEYGNPEVAYALIEKMARREGIGDILADSVAEAARRIGKGAEKYAFHIKNLEIKFHSYFSPYFAFTTAIGDRADTNCAGTGSMTPEGISFGMPIHEYVQRGFSPFPDDWEKFLYVDYSVNYEGLAEVAYYGENLKTLTDLLGICWNPSGFWPFTAIKLDSMLGLLSSATGTDFDEAQAFKIAARVRGLIQAYNVRLGLRRKDDTVPEKFFQQEVVGYQKKKGLKKLDHDKFEEQLDKHYQMKGWNNDAIPTAETLDKLGLSYVRQDLEKRGIL
ncbi:MAG: aldehyde dehydrogenase [Chloroflexi bacterium]|nr:aldehyde dehydrogenase [Chloroflexota bacterium]